MYLVCYKFDRRWLWWVPPRVRSTVRVFPASVMNLIMGDDGYVELVRFVGIIDRARWDEVPVTQSERTLGPRNYTVDYSAGVSWGPGGDYKYVDTVTGVPVDPWCANQCREGMYSVDSPFVEQSAHRRDTGCFPGRSGTYSKRRWSP